MQGDSAETEQAVKRLVLSRAGMFSNVLAVVQQIHLAMQGGYMFHVQWRKSRYANPNRPEDPWEYFFEQPYPRAKRLMKRQRKASGQQAPRIQHGTGVLCSTGSIVHPCRVDGDCDTAMFPRNPAKTARIVQNRIKLQPQMAAKIAAQRTALFSETPFIAVHLRGKHGLDCGARAARAAAGTPEEVPYHLYEAAIDDAVERMPDTPVLLCTDAEDVFAHMKKRYGSRIHAYDSLRVGSGEIFLQTEPGMAFQDDAERLGEDIIIEVYLMAQSAHLIHGLSNISRYVRFQNPDIPTDLVYDRLPIRKTWYQGAQNQKRLASAQPRIPE